MGGELVVGMGGEGRGMGSRDGLQCERIRG